MRRHEGDFLKCPACRPALVVCGGWILLMIGLLIWAVSVN